MSFFIIFKLSCFILFNIESNRIILLNTYISKQQIFPADERILLESIYLFDTPKWEEKKCAKNFSCVKYVYLPILVTLPLSFFCL